MQPAKMMLGAIIALLGALISVPIISRHLDAQSLGIATMSILAHGLFGVIDLFRPLIVKNIAENATFASYGNLFFPSAAVGLALSAIIAATSLLWGSEYRALSYSISLSVFIFCIYTPLWAAMEGNMRMGTAYLIRSMSVGGLYSLVAVGSLFNIRFLTYGSLIFANLFALALFWILGKNHVVRGPLTLGSAYFRRAAHMMVQNLSKVFNDFGDRVAASLFLPISLVGLYNLLSDLSGRSTFFAQMLTSYYYPVICRDQSRANGFLWIGVLFSAALLIACFTFFMLGHGLFVLYFGRPFSAYFPLFCALLACFSNYSLAFFGQAVARSYGRDADLSAAFGLSSILGVSVLFLLPGEMSLYKASVIALSLKSSSVILLTRLFLIFPAACLAGIVSSICSAAFVLYVYVYWGVP